MCVGVEEQVIALPQLGGVFTAQMLPTLSITVDNPTACSLRYAGRVLGARRVAYRRPKSIPLLTAAAIAFILIAIVTVYFRNVAGGSYE